MSAQGRRRRHKRKRVPQHQTPKPNEDRMASYEMLQVLFAGYLGHSVPSLTRRDIP